MQKDLNYFLKKQQSLTIENIISVIFDLEEEFKIWLANHFELDKNTVTSIYELIGEKQFNKKEPINFQIIYDAFVTYKNKLEKH